MQQREKSREEPVRTCRWGGNEFVEADTVACNCVACEPRHGLPLPTRFGKNSAVNPPVTVAVDKFSEQPWAHLYAQDLLVSISDPPAAEV